MEDQEIMNATKEILASYGRISDFKYKNDVSPPPSEGFNVTGPENNFSHNLETQIRSLKHNLENWREIILPVNSVLLWEKQWYPGALVGGTSILFLILWMVDPSALTFLSVVGLTLTVSDYLVPRLVSSFFKPESWTGVKEKQLDDICHTIIVYKTKIGISCGSFYLMRTTKPKLYYSCTVFSLVFLAWIGNSFNNLFLTYVLVTVLLLIPGMECHGILRKYGAAVTQRLQELTNNAKSKIGDIKKD